MTSASDSSAVADDLVQSLGEALRRHGFQAGDVVRGYADGPRSDALINMSVGADPSLHFSVEASCDGTYARALVVVDGSTNTNHVDRWYGSVTRGESRDAGKLICLQVVAKARSIVDRRAKKVAVKVKRLADELAADLIEEGSTSG